MERIFIVLGQMATSEGSKSDTEKYYDEISKGYDELYGKEQLEKIKIVKDLLKKLGMKFNSCLDAGCGTGISTSALIGFCNRIIGIDISEKMLEIARKKFNFDFIQMDIRNMNFPDENFDLIISITVLQDIPNPNEALKELKRVLKKNGYIILSFLKRSSRINPEMVKKYFKILDVIEEEKDYILLCKKL